MFKRLQSESSSLSEFRQNLGSLLYKFAWLIEICAVAIGITIAVMMMMSSFTESMKVSGNGFGVMEITNVIIAGLPFVMVAITELTKIPFAQACYYTTSRFWKIVFGIALLLISVITFESAFNGFERNDAALNYSIDKLRGDMNKLDETILPKQERIVELSALTIEKVEGKYNERNKSVFATKQEIINDLNSEIARLRSSVRTESTDLLKSQIADKTKEIAELRKQRDTDIKIERDQASQTSSNINSGLDAQKRTLQVQLSNEEKKLENLNSRKQAELADLGVFGSKRAVIDRYAPQTQSLQSTITDLREKILAIDPLANQREASQASKAEIDRIRKSYAELIKAKEDVRVELQQKVNLLIGANEEDIAGPIEQYQIQIQGAEKDSLIQQAKNKEDRDAQLARLENQTQQIDELQNQVQELKLSRVELRDGINIKVAENQIYRFAQKIYGVKSAADLERNQVQTVANIWYGSLAALVALTGVMLAFASFVASDPTFMDRERKRNEEPKQKISMRAAAIKLMVAIRRYFVTARRNPKKIVYKENIKEVVKEVPVQKVVLTEKPVEIIHKQLVHVPMYTNDPALLKTNPDFEFDLEENKKKFESKDVNNNNHHKD